MNPNYTRARNDHALVGDGAIAIADEVEPLDSRNSTKVCAATGFLATCAVRHKVFQLHILNAENFRTANVAKMVVLNGLCSRLL